MNKTFKVGSLVRSKHIKTGLTVGGVSTMIYIFPCSTSAKMVMGVLAASSYKVIRWTTKHPKETRDLLAGVLLAGEIVGFSTGNHIRENHYHFATPIMAMVPVSNQGSKKQQPVNQYLNSHGSNYEKTGRRCLGTLSMIHGGFRTFRALNMDKNQSYWFKAYELTSSALEFLVGGLILTQSIKPEKIPVKSWQLDTIACVLFFQDLTHKYVELGFLNPKLEQLTSSNNQLTSSNKELTSSKNTCEKNMIFAEELTQAYKDATTVCSDELKKFIKNTEERTLALKETKERTLALKETNTFCTEGLLELTTKHDLLLTDHEQLTTDHDLLTTKHDQLNLKHQDSERSRETCKTALAEKENQVKQEKQEIISLKEKLSSCTDENKDLKRSLGDSHLPEP